MAATLFSVRPHAKTGDPRPTVWEKHFQNRLSWRFRKKKRESRQNPRLTVGLGKFNAKTVYHGDSSRKSGAHAKARERLGKNRSGTRLSWRSRFFPMALTPKPATDLGKIDAKTVYYGDSARKSGNRSKTGDSQAAWENSSGTCLSWRPRNNPNWRSHSDWRNKKGCPLSSKRPTTTGPNFLVRLLKKSQR